MPPYVTRDRACCMYLPWIATVCTSLLIAGLGVWTKWTMECESLTVDALTALDVTVQYLDTVQTTLVATAVTYLVCAVLIFGLSFWRGFVEAGHDESGMTGRSATAFLIVNALANTIWWALVVWLVVLIMADSFWTALLYAAEQAIMTSLAQSAKYGQGTWVPSDGQLCPRQCLDLTAFWYIDSDLNSACICNTTKLGTALVSVQAAFKYMPAVLVGVWVMFVSGLWLHVNFACQFSHTRREAELLHRMTSKAFNAYG
ncbi:MAG: hypothetical protein WDW38_002079 [Sanguina aurantia]